MKNNPEIRGALLRLERNGSRVVVELEEVQEGITTEQSVALCTLEEVEANHIRNVLKATTTLEEAAKVLGINLSTLWRKRKQLRLE